MENFDKYADNNNQAHMPWLHQIAHLLLLVLKRFKPFSELVKSWDFPPNMPKLASTISSNYVSLSSIMGGHESAGSGA